MPDQSEATRVAEVVLRERAGRDTADWEAMRSTFMPDSHVHLSWFSGTGPEFVDASQKMYERGSRGFHAIGAISVDIVGDRALAHEGATVHARGTLAGVEIDLASHGRLYQRLVKSGREWYINALAMLYYKDVVCLADPASDPSPLAAYEFPIDRPYKYLAAILKTSGYTIGDDLPGTDRPELAAEYISAHNTWLHATQ